MKKPKRKNLKFPPINIFLDSLFVVYLLLLISLLVILWPSLMTRSNLQKEDSAVAICLDWGDLEAFARRDARDIGDMAREARDLPVQMMSVPFSLTKEGERKIRKYGFSILWRDDDRFSDDPTPTLDRLRPHDALASSNDYVIGYPRHLQDVAIQIKNRQGFLPVFEFQKHKGLGIYGRDDSLPFIKAHAILAEERLQESPAQLLSRVKRAANERWVRFFLIQLNPNLTYAQNAELLKQIKGLLISQNYVLGRPERFLKLGDGIRAKGAYLTDKIQKIPNPTREKSVLFLAILSPLLVFLFIRNHLSMGPWILFLSGSAFSILAGLVVHALGWDPRIILGVEAFRGIKAQLLAPLVFSLIFLFGKDDWAVLLRQPIRLKHAVYIFIGVVIFIGVYLMRSGNFPVLPVSGVERHFRDILDQLFMARPRFKEVLFGHPLMILSLYLLNKGNGNPRRGKALMVFLWAGLVGQISIINSFLHFHTPWSLSFLREINGIWIGGIVGALLVGLAAISQRHHDKDVR